VHWLLTTHAHHYNLSHGSSGRVWQGRYKAFPIEEDGHLLTVMRYVERNAVRAGLVDRARDWKWGSASWRRGPAPVSALIADSPVPLPASWDDFVDAPQTPAEEEEVRGCLNAQRPYGGREWVEGAPECRGFGGLRRPRGRPPIRAGRRQKIGECPQ
jgi:putative transposase